MSGCATKQGRGGYPRLDVDELAQTEGGVENGNSDCRISPIHARCLN
jgi:hypothetical protein